MTKRNVNDLLMLHKQLSDERQNYENKWQEIAERVAPDRANFKEHRSHMADAMYKGKSRTEHMYDATPALALQRFSAAFASMATPRNQMWHSIRPQDQELFGNKDVQLYTDAVRDRLFSARYAANFDVATQECYTDAGCFGNACMYIGEQLGKSLYYRHVPLEQVYWSVNEYGVVDWVDREFAMTARQAFERFGNKLPSTIIHAKDRTPNQPFWFIHMVMPRENIEQGRADHRGMAFESVYISLTGQQIVSESGFRTMPYAVLRFSGDANYGTGPSELVLPDIKMLNVMNRDMMQAAELAVMPPMLAAEDGIFSSGFNLTPGAINYGGIDRQTGRQLAVPMQFGSSLPIGMEMMNQKREIINDALWNTLFQILVQSPQMTATEAMLRAQEKGQLLAPAAARVESEFLEPAITREIDILAAHGELPEMPEVLAEQGGEVAIQYTNEFARLRQAEKGASIMRIVEQAASLAQVFGPEVLTRINGDEAVKQMLEISGAPAHIIRSDEEVAELTQQRMQEQQMQEAMAAAPVAASAAKDMAQAEAIAGEAGLMPPELTQQASQSADQAPEGMSPEEAAAMAQMMGMAQ